jgi:hypothetical protein
MDTQSLLFCLSGDISEDDVRILRRLVHELAKDYVWHYEPPRFLDELDSSSCTRSEDEPIRTVGGVLVIESPTDVHNRWAEKHHLDEVEYLVGRLARFSRERQCELELELAGEFIGDIVNGEISESIETGLIDEWRRSLS